MGSFTNGGQLPRYSTTCGNHGPIRPTAQQAVDLMQSYNELYQLVNDMSQVFDSRVALIDKVAAQMAVLETKSEVWDQRYDVINERWLLVMSEEDIRKNEITSVNTAFRFLNKKIDNLFEKLLVTRSELGLNNDNFTTINPIAEDLAAKRR